MPTLTAIPATLTAGDSYAITLSLAEYPAPTWDATFALAGAAVLSVTSTDVGSAHTLALTAVQTAALPAGDYTWRVRVTDGTQVTTVQTGSLVVLADVGALTPGESVSYYQQLKEAAEAALLALMQGGAVQQAMILGRQTMFRSPAECQRVIAYCDAKLAARRGGFGATIRFDVAGMR